MSPETCVHEVRAERSSVDGTDDELIKRLELEEAALGASRVHVDVSSEVDVGCERNDAHDIVLVDVGEEILQLEFATKNIGTLLERNSKKIRCELVEVSKRQGLAKPSQRSCEY